MNTELFKWMQYEKVLMFLLLTFLIVIASLNVVALLVMMVRDRRREIGVLMSIGAPRRQIAGIFLRLGLVISLTGVVTGTVLGLLVTLGLDRIGYELPGDVLFVDVLPVHAKVSDFALVAAVTLGLSALVSLLPAWLATRQSPVEVLRHE
jgi:lipoprotein-releasing system permease protein